MSEVKQFTTEFGGRTLTIEVGRLGGQANGVCLVTYGETSVLVNATMSAQEKAVARARMEGSAKGIKTFGDLHNTCEKDLGAYAKYFVHSLGHGVGVQIHEAPLVSKRSTVPLQNGIAFTIEPGVYLPGKLGIRIEDTLIMKNGKAEVLTKISKKLIVKK